jgi:hypothetical protein
MYSIYQRGQKRLDSIDKEITGIKKSIDQNQFIIDLFKHLIEKELPRMLRMQEEKHSDSEFINLQKLMENDKATAEQLVQLKHKLADRWRADPHEALAERLEILAIDNKLKSMGRVDLIGK